MNDLTQQFQGITMKTFSLIFAFVALSVSSGMAATVEATNETTQAQIASVIAKSDCAAGPWKPKDSGRAPQGFLTGIGLTYLKSFCELSKGSDGASADMGGPVRAKPHDVFAYFEREFRANAVALDTPIQRLRALYTLGIGVAMNESDGNPTAGPYIKDDPARAEAGLFQMSYDSLTASPPRSLWFARLYASYQASPGTCRTETFMKGLKDLKRKVVGEGTKAGNFQSFTKACPSFATEYGLVELRRVPTYFGTVIGTNPHGQSNKAQFVPVCYKLLQDLEPLANCSR